MCWYLKPVILAMGWDLPIEDNKKQIKNLNKKKY